jgi:hypothetical protein
MDPLLQNTVFGVSFATICAVMFAFYKCVNHRMCVSRCCGHRADLSLDVGETPLSQRGMRTPNAAVPLLPPIRIPIAPEAKTPPGK